METASRHLLCAPTTALSLWGPLGFVVFLVHYLGTLPDSVSQFLVLNPSFPLPAVFLRPSILLHMLLAQQCPRHRDFRDMPEFSDPTFSLKCQLNAKSVFKSHKNLKKILHLNFF